MKDGLDEHQEWALKEVERILPIVLKFEEPNRSRSLTGLAYEYFIQDMEEKAFKILEMCDPNYFKEPMKQDMKDPAMEKIIMTIVAKLIESGYVIVSADDDKKG